MQTHIVFEHPLNEKMRTWLRIEFLLKQIQAHLQVQNYASALPFFRNIGDLLDVLERGEIRTDLLKDLERQQRKLSAWGEVPGVDHSRINALVQQFRQHASALMAAPRLGQLLREERLVALVRQRSGIPGGCCNFDLPVLHIWLHLPQTQRDQQTHDWYHSLQPLSQALMLLLDVTRNFAIFRPQTCVNGFYQDNSGENDLLRLQLNIADALYPQVSGHKNRFAIRFMPLDCDNGKVPERLDFAFSCC